MREQLAPTSRITSPEVVLQCDHRYEDLLSDCSSFSTQRIWCPRDQQIWLRSNNKRFGSKSLILKIDQFLWETRI
jgi:hypothetical protein